jgi:1-acyl-sn-glycerol-3-phosphate acyltransferase
LTNGLAFATFRFHRLSPAQRSFHVQRWSAALLQILAIRLKVTGFSPHAGRPAMIVANHVSWLDVYALNAVCPAHFVAKSEIGRWPLIGLFARKSGTVFIERARKRDILRVNAQIAVMLRTGAMMAVFPEGTTSEGDAVLPFRPPLLQSAVDCSARLQPVAIRYERADGSLCNEACFVGDTTFVATLWLVLKQPGIDARLQFLPAVSCGGRHRKALARETELRIASALGLKP